MPPVDTSSNPARTSPPAKAASPVLSETESKRPMRHRHGRVRAIEIDDDMPAIAIDGDCPGEQHRHGPWQEAMLDRADPCVQRLDVVARQDGHGFLRHDRTAVEGCVDEVDRAAADR